MPDNLTLATNNPANTLQQPPVKTPKSTSPKFDQMKYPALFVAIGLLLAAGIWVLSEIQEDEPEITITKPFTSCRTDDECVIVPYRFCCIEANAINKKYEQEYLNNPDWQTAPQSPGICARIECRDADLSSYDAQCINNKCTPIRKESASTSTSTWQTYRNDEIGFEIQHPESYQVLNEGALIVILVNGASQYNLYIMVSEEPMLLGSQGHVAYGPITESETDQEIVSSKEVQINGVTFTKNYWSEGYTIITAHTNYEGQVHTLALDSNGGLRSEDKKEIIIFDQILSTFRFVP